MKCKKHGDAPAALIECPYCGSTHRVYETDLGATVKLQCRSCGGALSKGDVIADRVTEKACDACGTPFCDGCLIDVRGEFYCEKCASDLINQYEKEKERKEYLERETAEEERLTRIEEQQKTAATSPKKGKSGCGCVLTITVALFIIAIVIVVILAI